MQSSIIQGQPSFSLRVCQTIRLPLLLFLIIGLIKHMALKRWGDAFILSGSI